MKKIIIGIMILFGLTLFAEESATQSKNTSNSAMKIEIVNTTSTAISLLNMEKKEPLIAVIGSLGISGLGHIYVGDSLRGIPFFVGEIVGWTLVISNPPWHVSKDINGNPMVTTLDGKLAGVLILAVDKLLASVDSAVQVNNYNRAIDIKYGLNKDGNGEIKATYNF